MMATYHLKEVFDKIKEKHGSDLPVKPKDSGEVLKKFFREILPDFDEDQVYNSDIKKVVTWYNLLKDTLDEPDEDDDHSDTSEKTEESDDKKEQEDEITES